MLFAAFLLVYTLLLEGESKILRIGDNYVARFVLIDSDLRIKSNCIRNITKFTTPQECSSECIKDKNCLSINRHRELGICELLAISKFNETGLLQRDANWVHFETDDDEQNVGSLCADLSPCQPYEICEMTFECDPAFTCGCRDGFRGAKCETYEGPGTEKSNPAASCYLLMSKFKSVPDNEYWFKGQDKRIRCERGVNGGYTKWSSFSPCSYYPCGGYITQQRNRTCTKPSPKGEGRSCDSLGPSKEVRRIYIKCPEAKDLAGNWSVTYIPRDVNYIIKEDGSITLRRKTQKLQKSDNQVIFPSSEGWYLAKDLHRSTVWEYIRLKEDDTLEFHHFCSNGICISNYKELVNYWKKGVGTKNKKECPVKTLFPVTPFTLQKGYLVTTFGTSLRNFKVKMDLKVDATKLTGGYRNVFHFTIDGTETGFGERIPAMFIKKINDGKEVEILPCFAVNGNNDYQRSIKKSASLLDSWFHVEISQSQGVYKVVLNGDTEHEVTNNQRKRFYDVKLYLSNTRHNAAPAMIKNLHLEGFCEKRCRI